MDMKVEAGSGGWGGAASPGGGSGALPVELLLVPGGWRLPAWCRPCVRARAACGLGAGDGIVTVAAGLQDGA
jgi:hypothetical protein